MRDKPAVTSYPSLVLGVLILQASCAGAISSDDEPEAARSPGAPGEPAAGPGRDSEPAGGRPGVGSAGAPGAPPSGATTPGATMPGAAMPGAPASVPPLVVSAPCGPMSRPQASPRIWRLSAEQYARTVDTLFAGRSKDRNRDLPRQKVLAPFGAVNESDRFSTASESYFMRDGEMRDALVSAEDVASRLVSALWTSTCLAQDAGFDRCIAAMVEERGELAFRRPLTQEEVATYARLATEIAPTVGRRAATEAAFRAILMAPQFLYRAEIGGGTPDRDGLRRLQPFEIASAISYSLTGGPPDASLWDAARGGALVDPKVIAAHVARMAESPASLSTLKAFVREYFSYDEAGSLDKKGGPGGGVLETETDLVVAELLGTSGRKDLLRALLTSNLVFANSRTASVNGVMNNTFEVKRFVLPETSDRAGLLGQPSWMWAQSQPERTDVPKRGRFVREHLLCNSLPDFDASKVKPLSKDATLTMRQKLTMHRVDPACAGCHALIDPMGLAMEGFDHLGKERREELGKPVDVTGGLVGSEDQDGPVRGLKELTAKLAASRTVRRCFAAESLQYWLGRRAQGGDECAVEAMDKAFAASGGDYVALLQALYTSEPFLFKRP